MSKKEVVLIPYIHFQGNCEEALGIYEEILDGKVEIMERYDNPAMQAPINYKEKVLHARFLFNDCEIYASDVFPGQIVNLDNNNVALSLTFTDLEKAKIIFSQLSKNGNIRVPFEKQFWGAWHGNFTDRFGIRWMINVE